MSEHKKQICDIICTDAANLVRDNLPNPYARTLRNQRNNVDYIELFYTWVVLKSVLNENEIEFMIIQNMNGLLKSCLKYHKRTNLKLHHFETVCIQIREWNDDHDVEKEVLLDTAEFIFNHTSFEKFRFATTHLLAELAQEFPDCFASNAFVNIHKDLLIKTRDFCDKALSSGLSNMDHLLEEVVQLWNGCGFFERVEAAMGHLDALRRRHDTRRQQELDITMTPTVPSSRISNLFF